MRISDLVRESSDKPDEVFKIVFNLVGYSERILNCLS